MARIVLLAICLTVAPSVIGRRHTPHLTESRKENSTVSAQVSSLGYPCNLEEFRRAGFASEWDKSCGKYHKLVFLHVPKTAGESVEAALKLSKNHNGARLRREKMGEMAWGCAFKFSVARNPWARWESWYSFCKSGYHVHKRGVLPEPHWGCQMARSMTLSSWTKNMILILGGLGNLPPDLRTNMTRTGGDFYWAWFFESQSEYVTDGVHLDVLLPNFIISFENIESDFNCMTTLLGLPVNLRHKNPSVLVKGESTAERVSEFDLEARELIGRYNRFEIEQYGYEFPV